MAGPALANAGMSITFGQTYYDVHSPIVGGVMFRRSFLADTFTAENRPQTGVQDG
jgi:hypothetical protein